MKETVATNSSYTQAGVSCFVGQGSAKFEVQFFVGSTVVKISCLRLVAKRYTPISPFPSAFSN
ncbi:MAG: hypothetical protein ACOXZ9_05855 [Bacteroidales bacterium]|jgi:hypothetical protein